jgi:hypothetical protein
MDEETESPIGALEATEVEDENENELGDGGYTGTLCPKSSV